MTAGFRQFDAQLNREVGAIKKEVVGFQRKIVRETLFVLGRNTPVDTGFAQGAFVIGVGGAPGKSVTAIRPIRQMVAEETAKLSGSQRLETVTIDSAAEYFEQLDQGSSQQAPNGVTSVSLQELKTRFP